LAVLVVDRLTVLDVMVPQVLAMARSRLVAV
jgi:hypothetical protein